MDGVVRPRQPAKIEDDTVGAARRSIAQQLPVVAAVSLPGARHTVGGQQGVGVPHGVGLDVQPDDPAVFSRKPAQKQGVVTVAAGGVQIQPAGRHPLRQKPVGQFHGGQVRYPLAAKDAVPGQKTKFFCQRPGGRIVLLWQRRTERGGHSRRKSIVAAQNFLEQIAPVSPSAPGRINHKAGQISLPQHRLPDGDALLEQGVFFSAVQNLHTITAFCVPPRLYGGCAGLSTRKNMGFHIFFTVERNCFHNWRVY